MNFSVPNPTSSRSKPWASFRWGVLVRENNFLRSHRSTAGIHVAGASPRQFLDWLQGTWIELVTVLPAGACRLFWLVFSRSLTKLGLIVSLAHLARSRLLGSSLLLLDHHHRRKSGPSARPASDTDLTAPLACSGQITIRCVVNILQLRNSRCSRKNGFKTMSHNDLAIVLPQAKARG